ncbi:MAG TPA: PEP-CTERM sorting domain-containing protein [Terriglobia bacterium]
MEKNGRTLQVSLGEAMQARKWFGLLGSSLLLGSLTVVIASSGFATTISANGTCEVGDCIHPGILGVGQATSGTASFTYTFADTDHYDIVVVFSASDSGGTSFSISTAGLATYEGNAHGTASGTDVLAIDFSQFYQSFITSGTFHESISGTFGGELADGSNATFQLFQGGYPMPLLGPFFPPNPFSASASGFQVTGLHNPLNTTAVFTETFASGSVAGADMNLGGVVTPEPCSLLLFATGLIGLAGTRRRQRAR